ncbi:MAG: LysR family transcriptional regulator [Betaproteobacteria bacterium]|nr:LysR family transcriptional regulator [Betaproteobacteria bacterium]
MLSISSLRTFMAVVETASFTAAALRLHATQSGVSQRIAKLEHQLKVQLFLRTPQGATATLAGRQLYQRASAILGLLSEAETELGLFAGGLEGSIHIGLMPALMRSVAGPVQRRLIAQHPNLEIRLTELVSSDLIQSVLRSEIDFAIVPRFDAPDSVLMTSLGSTYEVLVLANRYIENHGQPVDLGQQRPLSLVLQSPGSIRRDSILERLKSAGIKVDQVVNIDSMFGTFEYIEDT